jgi:hypothetical protein
MRVRQFGNGAGWAGWMLIAGSLGAGTAGNAPCAYEVTSRTSSDHQPNNAREAFRKQALHLNRRAPAHASRIITSPQLSLPFESFSLRDQVN